MTDNIAFAVQPDAQRLSDAERGQLLADPGFGKVFTDHMATIRWSGGQGWHSAEVRARAPFTIDPASAVLHYAREIFERMKAYRSADGRISLFRPEENARRFRESAARMAMPQIPNTCSWRRLRNSWTSSVTGSPMRRAASTCGRSCLPAKRSSASGLQQNIYSVSSLPPPAPISRAVDDP